MRKIAADYIFPVSSPEFKNGLIIIDDNGEILSLDKASNHDPASIEILEGIIVPGLINTHCHLELSHMKNLIPTGTGLIEFISSVVKFRDFPQEQIDDAIQNADLEMYAAGIQAVGDICNKLDTAKTKTVSKISYYSFVEMFDFIQKNLTQKTIHQYQAVYDQQSYSNGNKKSLVPHAPYSVSKELFQYINKQNQSGSTVSIHNQETFDENLLFTKKEGKFLEFYKSFGMNLDHFPVYAKTAIHYALEHMDPNQKTIFVHNTMTNTADIKAANKWSDRVYWASCANANLYIENRLPDYNIFIDSQAKMTIGTDSLSSNWQLSVWEELKTINKYNSYIPFKTLLQWATLNGAEALSYEKQLGSIEVGKKPGLIHIKMDFDSFRNDLSNTNPERIV